MGRIFCVLCAAALAQGAEQGKTPGELLEFVRNARSMGLKDPEIQRGALKAGWDAGMVNQALSMAEPQLGGGTPGRAGGSVEVAPGYRVGAGDVLQIVVWKEPDASVPGVTVRSDGKITMPLLKEVYVLGMTPTELEKTLTQKLSKFVLGADVTVVPKEIHSLKVYIVGGVRREGALPLTRSMTVLQAITEAGGLNEYAKAKKVYVLRNQDGRHIRLPFDYQAFIKGERIDQNVVLMPDDTVVVPR